MNRIRKSVLLLAAVGLVAVLAGCGVMAEGDGEPREPFGTIVIDNDSPLTVNVYAIRHSGRFRLGTINGLQREQFPIRSHMLDTGSFLQVQIEPLGGQGSYFSERIYVEQGEEVRLRVSNFIR